MLLLKFIEKLQFGRQRRTGNFEINFKKYVLKSEGRSASKNLKIELKTETLY